MSKNISAIKHTLRKKLKAYYEEAHDSMQRRRTESTALKKLCCLFMAKACMAQARMVLLKLHALQVQEKKLQEYRRQYGVSTSN